MLIGLRVRLNRRAYGVCVRHRGSCSGRPVPWRLPTRGGYLCHHTRCSFPRCGLVRTSCWHRWACSALLSEVLFQALNSRELPTTMHTAGHSVHSLTSILCSSKNGLGLTGFRMFTRLMGEHYSSINKIQPTDCARHPLLLYTRLQ